MKASIVAFSFLTSLVSGLALPEVAPRGTQVFQPTLAINIKEASPNTAFGKTTTGTVFRDNGPHEVQTLLSYDLPALPGMTCSLTFSNPATLSGSQRMQIFDVGGPITEANTFLTRPYRNNYRCAMTVKAAGQGAASIDDNISCTFPCPSSATTLGFEAVPRWDSVEITWDTTTSGLVIEAN